MYIRDAYLKEMDSEVMVCRSEDYTSLWIRNTRNGKIVFMDMTEKQRVALIEALSAPALSFGELP